MSRVAKALRKAGAQAPTDDAWDRSTARARQERQEGQGARGDGLADDGLPWNLHDIADAGAAQVEQAQAASPDADALHAHLAALVRRVFLPPPIGAGLRSVLFCSADSGIEPVRIASACAHVLASQTQKRVCLLDTQGDGRAAPRGSEDEANDRIVGAARRMSGNLWIATSAQIVRATPADVATRQIRELCARFDHLIVDAPPLHDGAEPLVLASLVQGVILVVDGERTRRDSARHAAEALDAAGARLLGVVLANQRYPIPEPVYARL